MSYDLDNYLWTLGVGGVFAFFAAFGIGANDVANAYATAIGSGAMTFRMAVASAAVFEFSGAILMGSHVTKTIRKGIADHECFEEQPELLMYGCMCVLAAVGIWLLTASRLSLPVSTTHSTIGGMIGMALVAGGSGCVTWDEPTDEFPYRKGVTAIVISWLLSPVLSGFCASLLFWVVRAVLRTQESFRNMWRLYPFLVGATITINTFFIMWKGAKNASDDIDSLSVGEVVAISFGVGGAASILTLPATRWLRQRIEGRDDLSEVAHKYHPDSEDFPQKSEEGLKFLQIFTSMCDSFAHGANDVANAIGPFAAIYMTWREKGVSKSVDLGDDAYWILAIGGVGIVAGLAIYGYNIIHTIGTKIAKITPSRGICIELGSAIVVITGSRYGWPLSTTHCQVGATTAVALMEGSKGLDWNILLKTCVGWVATLVIVGGITALLFAQGIHAPCA
jgi:sodium-dependent phosphate transporter